jgi:hypothetical protein
MLSSPLFRPRRPQQQSLRHEYAEFLEQRIEEYKEQLSRKDLLAIADEAVSELEVASEEQLVLTEVLVLEHVDRLIMQRLELPTFRKWRHRHVKLRQAQRDPSYWGLRSRDPVAKLAARLDDTQSALVLGEEAIPAALMLAACDWQVLFIDSTLPAVESIEKLAATEGLAPRVQALVVQLGQWFPEAAPSLVVLDPMVLSDLNAASRVRILDALKQMTASGGIHCFLPTESSDGALAPAVVRAHYGDWSSHHRSAEFPDWFLSTKP